MDIALRVAKRLSPIIIGQSAISGEGAIANHDFKPGDLIDWFRGELLDWSDINYGTYIDDHVLQISKDKYVGPADTADDRANHSCNPNSGLIIKDGRAWLVAIKPIQKGEEVTWDYSTSIGDNDESTFECNCGEPNCRGVIGKWNDLPEELKEMYKELSISPANGY